MDDRARCVECGDELGAERVEDRDGVDDPADHRPLAEHADVQVRDEAQREAEPGTQRER